MTHRFSPGQSRAAAVMLLFAVLGTCFAAVAIPTWLLHKRYDTHLADFTDRLQRYQRVAALRPQVEEAIREVEALAGRQFYLKATAPGAAAAELQGLVTRLVEARGGKIMSSQVLPSKEEAKGAEPLKATISVQMNASIISLLTILHSLETSQPYLFVDQLSVRAGQGRNFRATPGVEPEYVVQLTVSGFAPAGAGKP